MRGRSDPSVPFLLREVEHTLFRFEGPPKRRGVFFFKKTFQNVWRMKKELYIWDMNNTQTHNTMNLPTQLQGFEEQISNLMVYIQVKGLTFETESDLQDIMKQWIKDGMKLTNKIQTPQGMEFMYQMTAKNI